MYDFTTWNANPGPGEITLNPNRLVMKGAEDQFGNTFATSNQTQLLKKGDLIPFRVRYRVPGHSMVGIVNQSENKSIFLYQVKALSGNADDGLICVRENNHNFYQDPNIFVTDKKMYRIDFEVNDDGFMNVYFDDVLIYVSNTQYADKNCMAYVQIGFNGGEIVVRNG